MNILIRNGLIVDGTGSSGFIADILIKNDKIEQIGENIEAKDCELIDASDRVVSPGFIDMHSHGDLTILEVKEAEASIMQGVTTLLVGNCGIGLAPANEKVRTYYTDLVSKLFGTSDLELYDTLQEQMDKIKKKGTSINLAFLIPHGNVRAMFLGMEEQPATVEQIEEMKKVIGREMRAGAFGLSTGLIYPPGYITSTEELIEVCKALKEYDGLYDSHMRNEGKEILDRGIGEVIKIAEGAQIRAHISHLKAGGLFSHRVTPKVIDLIRSQREKGLFLHADLYPYEEVLLFLSVIMLPAWVLDDFEENLTNPETRKKIMDASMEYFYQFLSELPAIVRIIPRFIMKRLVYWYLKRKIRVVRVLKNHHIEGKYLGKALKTLYPNRKFIDALLDFIRDEEASITLSSKFMDEDKSITEFFKQEFVCIGSDGFLMPRGNTHPRTYGTFPRILGEYVRERQLVPLEEGIRKMTGLPASILGLNDRGLIKEGYKADLVIFNQKTIKDKATYENGRQFPDGIDYVIVNGEPTVSKGKHLGALNGQVLKYKASEK